MRINDYSRVHKVIGTDVFLLDGNDGTRTITADELFFALAETADPKVHNCLIRGKNLGDTFTAEQKAAIQNGSFEDLWLGDYWEDSSGRRWRIADIDYWYGTKGSNSQVTTGHHVVIVPDQNLFTADCMNESDDTSTGYSGSYMHTVHMPQALTMAETMFPGSVLGRREYFINGATNGKPDSYEYIDRMKIMLMTERMVYGTPIMAQANDGVELYQNLRTMSQSQLSLFALDKTFIHTGQSYWLQDVVSSGQFASVYYNGNAYYYYASLGNGGVRPVFAVG